MEDDLRHITLSLALTRNGVVGPDVAQDINLVKILNSVYPTLHPG